MGNFRNYFEASGMTSQDFSHMPMNTRMAQGRNIGEAFIIAELKKHGVNITPSQGYYADAKLKIDGYLNGNKSEPVQIKLRRSGLGNRNDIAYEVCRNHDPQVMLVDQLKDIHHQGRDFRGESVKHYYVMNNTETEIYYTYAPALKAVVLQAIRQMNLSPMGGKLNKSFIASNGVDLRPTRDPDPESFTPSKVMAFIPVESVSMQTYPINARNV